jgi:acyl carrier protein
MDMEADLGIDSIKRVEILGAMQSRFPDLPKADTTALAEMRTLGQIVEYMSASEIANPDTSKKTTDATQSEDIETTKEPIQKVSGSSNFSLQEIRDALLEIVSQKTGYPTEMLEMGMDMEADLGIDSIKRVEILGAMQERFPELPKVDAAILAEMRTLGQISDYMSSEIDTEDIKIENPNAAMPIVADESYSQDQTSESSISIESPKPDLIRGVISLRSLPLPDQLKMEISTNQISLVVDDGSELTTKLAENLISHGIKVVVLSLPQTLVLRKSVLSDSVEQVSLNEIAEESIRSTLKKVEQEFGPVGIFIHLDPPGNGLEEFSETEKKIVKIVFLMAKHLKENLTLAGKNGYAAFITVTHLDGQFGLSMSNPAEPVSGGLFGLTKTLNLEWEDVFCRAIDLIPEMDSEMAAGCITAELFDPNRLISEVAYNKNGRFTLEVQLPESVVQS